MNVTSLTLYISQITFGMIFVFALTSFIIYKVKGKNGGNVSFQPEIQHEASKHQTAKFDHHKLNSNVVSYSVESVPLVETVISTASISRNTFSDVKTTSKSINNRARFTVMNNTFEQTVEKPRALNNWS
jgi:hypothetical protein